MDFPRTVDEITPEWLTQVLRESGAIDSEHVVSFQSQRIGVETGLSGVLHRLTLEYDGDDAGLPNSVVAKYPSDSHELRIRRLSTNKIEISFYKNFVKEVDIDVPSLYFGEIDEDTGECLLLLEDLGHLRAVPQTEDCSIDDAFALLSGISRIHAHYWSGRPGFDQIPDHLTTAPTGNFTRENMEKNTGTFVELVGDVLPNGIESMAWRLAPQLSKVVKMVYTPPITLIHGDLKLINMFFDDSVVDPPKLVVYDWQALRAAKAALDVGLWRSRHGVVFALFERISQQYNLV